MSKKTDISLEKNLERLRQIVEQMQASQLDFDENVSLFKEGMQLIRKSRSYLDESELLIQKLIEGENGIKTGEFE